MHVKIRTSKRYRKNNSPSSRRENKDKQQKRTNEEKQEKMKKGIFIFYEKKKLRGKKMNSDISVISVWIQPIQLEVIKYKNAENLGSQNMEKGIPDKQH